MKFLVRSKKHCFEAHRNTFILCKIITYPMVKPPKTKIYSCTRCDYEWLQRHTVKRDSDGKKIKSIESEEPKNCSRCKSPYWFTDKNRRKQEIKA